MPLSKTQFAREVRNLVILASLGVASACVFANWDYIAAALRREQEAPATVAATRLPIEPISVEGAALEGSKSARLVVVLFSDFGCPACRRFATEGLPELRSRFIEPGRVMLAFRHMPQERLHPLGFRAAVVAACAAKEGRFRATHDALFNLAKLTADSLDAVAASVVMNSISFQRCVETDGPALVKRDVNEARLLHIPGTPTFFIGVPSDGRVRVIHAVVGFGRSSSLLTDLDRLETSLDHP